ncbi:MAG: DUF5011 domain-containing protein, partial [Planctomycetes bacterium]|nr:DUF5011 domain-containing protein [Planctomycetota bacterium]
NCGRATCSATFTIEDTPPPIIRGLRDVIVECDGRGNAEELRRWLGSATADDACGRVRLSNDFSGLSDDCGATGSVTVTWTATDECRNTSTHTASFTIVDTTPPRLSGPPDLTVECDGRGNPDELRDWLNDVRAADACGLVRITHDFTGLSDDCGETGAATVIWTASDECGNTDTHTATFTIIDTTPPVITLIGNAMITLECHVDPYVEQGASVADACDPGLTRAVVGGDPVDPNTVGVYVVTYDATDACGNRAEQVTRVVEVVDTIPPVVTVGPMVLLWPPNHEYRTLNLSDCVESVFDLCEGSLAVNELGTILSIYSDEPEDAPGGGDGHTLNDIVLVSNSSLMVRAERQGGGNGRVYGITFQVVDASGNITETICFVGVPHDQSGGLPIDDGPEAGYTVP